MLEASVEDIEYRDGWLTVVGTTSASARSTSRKRKMARA